jgi:hypothetical protein
MMTTAPSPYLHSRAVIYNVYIATFAFVRRLFCN